MISGTSFSLVAVSGAKQNNLFFAPVSGVKLEL
jgi:hypothetical protein